MSTIDYAKARAEVSSDPHLFMLAFHAGWKASPGEDTEGYVRSLIAQGDTAAAAGYLEGLAARRKVAANAKAVTRKAVTA
ncbi:hypothetical protein [Streptomyces sp. SAJ15]|uniref:hypothetical protein n=1 Tax=Streptomyces sp. SAJ15 TaxID=2011095 RepID=UPI001184C21E|nr:hypothetical protein [Streptomyces sp. SAJ15]TVL89826.1 hypothetical protein CD790_25880 [Streptomyces sp. SAJ15]